MALGGACARRPQPRRRDSREGKTGLREQPQIKVQTRVRVSLFVREMHGPWIWPAEVAAAHVKAEVRHLATRIDGQAASCFGGLQATESSFVATGIVCCGVVEGGGFASREQRSGWRRHPGELADFAPEVSVRVSPLFPGMAFSLLKPLSFWPSGCVGSAPV